MHRGYFCREGGVFDHAIYTGAGRRGATDEPAAG
jgi:hypothetical protein